MSTDGNTVHLPPVLIEPMAADDVASTVASIAVGSPINGMIEVGGPEQFRLDDLIRATLAVCGDPREVVTDPRARYYGIEVTERALVPADDARVGETHFDEWIVHSVPEIPRRIPQPAATNPGSRPHL